MKPIAVILVVWVLCGLLFGCATPTDDRPNAYGPYAECTVPVTRDAGMGVKVSGCAAWTIGRLKKAQ